MAFVSRDVTKIRTFATDAVLARPLEQEKSPAPQKAPTVSQAPTETPHEDAIGHTVIYAESVKIPAAPLRHMTKTDVVAPPKTTTATKARVATSAPQPKPASQHVSTPLHQTDKRFLNLEEEMGKIKPHHQLSTLGDESTFELGGGGGTIIRDTKRKRFRLLPAMVQAAMQWFTHQRETYDVYRHPYSEMTTSEARKDVISAAVAKSALAPKEDFKEVAERKKREEHAPIESTLLVKNKEATPQPQWSHVDFDETPTDELSPLPHEGPASVVLNTPVTPFKSEYVKTAREKILLEEEPRVLQPVARDDIQDEIQSETIVPLKNTKQAQVIEQVPATDKAVLPIEEVRSQPLEAVPIQTPEQLEPQVDIGPASPNQRGPHDYNAQVQPSLKTANLFRFMLIGVIVVSTLSGVSLSVYLFSSLREPQAQEITHSFTVPTLLRAHTQEPIALLNNRAVFLESVLSRVLENQSSVVQLYPTVQTQSGSTRPASAQETLSILSPRTASSFVRGVREMTLGSVAGEPFIVLRTGSFDVAFAGMLEWESTLSADLSPLFGTPVVDSFDPSARTDSQVRAAFFKDMIASNKNARLLFDERGNDRVVYTFIDQNTILITTTRKALNTLVPLIH